MTKYLIGVMTDYEPADIENWIVSAKRNSGADVIVMMTYNLRHSALEYLDKNGITIWQVPPSDTDTNSFVYYYADRARFNVCVERFKHLPMFIDKQCDRDDLLVITDVKDVVFQADAFKKIKDSQIVLSSEDVSYETEIWGNQNLRYSFGDDIFNRLKNFQIVNAGVIAGKPKYLVDLLRLTSALCQNKPPYIIGGGGPDQAALNVAFRLGNWGSIVDVFNLTNGWAVQAGTTNDPTKPYIKDEFLQPWFDEDKAVVREPITGYVYPIVHQYDRVPEWSTHIKQKYKSGDNE